MPLRLIAAYKTDVGKQREQNEDNAFQRVVDAEDGETALFVVADGMGGYQAGEVASKIAVKTISESLSSFFQPISEQPTLRLSPTPAEEQPTVIMNPQPPVEAFQPPPQKTTKLRETPMLKPIEDRLRNAIQKANGDIIRYGEQQTGARGLGCTVTAVFVQDERAYIANVGDSRTYLMRGDHFAPLTKDHSLVAKLVEANQITPEEAYSHPQRNLIYRSLGAGHKNVEVDIFQETLQPGDTLLLCSDGLWEMVRDQDLRRALSESKSPQEICDTLIDLANANGGEDNITALVVRVEGR